VDLKDIKKIVELMNEQGLSHFHLKQGEFNLKLKKGPDADFVASMMSSMHRVPQVQNYSPASAAQASSPAQEPVAQTEGKPFTSPMVGTFFRKPSPDTDNYVEVGSKVKEGQTLCIIEAMKVMNEIKAETSGTIVSIAVDDSTAVQFGDTLFTIK
jgi:acetyl-CoA carboxylase biotin carboxyl carrier protein